MVTRAVCGWLLGLVKTPDTGLIPVRTARNEPTPGNDHCARDRVRPGRLPGRHLIVSGLLPPGATGSAMNITHTMLVAVGALALSVPPPEDPAPGEDADAAAGDAIPVTEETLAGIWIVDGWPGILNQIGADGLFVFDFDGEIDSSPFGVGTYDLEGREVIISVANGACSDWAFHVDDIPQDGSVTATYSRAGCHVAAGEPWNLTRLSPISAAASVVAEPLSVFDGPPHVTASLLSGIWLREGTGQLASFTADGAYSVDDGGLLGVASDDTGTFEVDGDTVVMSSTGGASCAAGSTATWSDSVLDSVKFAEDELYEWRWRLTTSDHECVGWSAGDQTWLRVSP